jgi:hypothetical protein
MRELFSYNLLYKVKEDVTEELEPGKKTITTKLVEKPVRVILKEQNRADMSAANSVYQIEWSDAIRKGILPRSLISKKFRESEGILTPNEIKALEEINKIIEDVKDEYQTINSKETKSKEDEDKIQELMEKFSWANEQLASLEEVNESLFQNSAENLAWSKQLMFNILNLSHVEFVPGKIIPYTQGDTLDEKLEYLDKIAADESSDESKEKARLYDEILSINTEFLKLVSTGKVTKEQFPAIRESIEKKEVKIEPPAEEVKKESKIEVIPAEDKIV